MCIHIYGSWLAISSSKSMNNVKPDCCKVVDFFIPFPHPSLTQYSRSLTLPKIGAFLLWFFLMLIVILEWPGWGYWFCKMKVLHWFNYVDYGSSFLETAPELLVPRWGRRVAGRGRHHGREETGSDPAALGPRQPQLPKSPRPWPWLDRASGPTSDQFHCCPDPSRQFPIQTPRVHLQEKTSQTLMQIHCLGSHSPGFPQTIPSQGRKVLPPSAGPGLLANRFRSDTRRVRSWNAPISNHDGCILMNLNLG